MTAEPGTQPTFDLDLYLSLPRVAGLALSPDGGLIALGAGPRGRPTPEFNCAYLLRLPPAK